MEWFWRLLCRLNMTHSPERVKLEQMSITPESRCKFCGERIGLDSQGNWFLFPTQLNK